MKKVKEWFSKLKAWELVYISTIITIHNAIVTIINIAIHLKK